jgi:hypothetical protein
VRRETDEGRRTGAGCCPSAEVGRAECTGAERTLAASYDKLSSAVIVSVDGSAR